jgi:hypothetical protein
LRTQENDHLHNHSLWIDAALFTWPEQIVPKVACGPRAGHARVGEPTYPAQLLFLTAALGRCLPSHQHVQVAVVLLKADVLGAARETAYRLIFDVIVFAKTIDTKNEKALVEV